MTNGDGGPAFPLEHHHPAAGCHVGMSLRDYLACHILESIIAPGTDPNLATAQKAYEWAGLMIQARGMI
jgi:hypothetical protein